METQKQKKIIKQNNNQKKKQNYKNNQSINKYLIQAKKIFMIY